MQHTYFFIVFSRPQTCQNCMHCSFLIDRQATFFQCRVLLQCQNRSDSILSTSQQHINLLSEVSLAVISSAPWVGWCQSTGSQHNHQCLHLVYRQDAMADSRQNITSIVRLGCLIKTFCKKSTKISSFVHLCQPNFAWII